MAKKGSQLSVRTATEIQGGEFVILGYAGKSYQMTLDELKKFIGIIEDSGGSVDLTQVSTDILPLADVSKDIGSLEKRWKKVYSTALTVKAQSVDEEEVNIHDGGIEGKIGQDIQWSIDGSGKANFYELTVDGADVATMDYVNNELSKYVTTDTLTKNYVSNSSLTEILKKYYESGYVDFLLSSKASTGDLNKTNTKLGIVQTDVATLKSYFQDTDDVDDIINKWRELEAFLAGQTETSTLADLLTSKADTSVVDALASRVSQNESNIADHTNKITANTNNIDNTIRRVAANEADLEQLIQTVDKIYGEYVTISDIPTKTSQLIDDIGYALARNIKALAGLDIVTKDYIADAAVTTSKIKDGAITSDKLSTAIQQQLSWIPSTTDDLPEGSSNLYFTNARAIAALSDTLKGYVTTLAFQDYAKQIQQNSTNITKLNKTVDKIYEEYVTSEDIPTKTSQLIDDIGYVNEIAASGTGNGIASVSKDGSKLTFTKATFLTSHQSLDGYINNVSDEGSGNVITDYRKSGKNLVLQKGLSVYSKAEVDKLIGDISIPDLDGYVTTETLTISLNNLANTYLSFRGGGTVSGATTFSGGLSVQNSLTLLGVNVAAGSSGLTFDGKIPMYSGDAYTKSEAAKEFHPLTTVDTAPTINSSNLVTSGGVAKAVADLAESADRLYQRKGSYLTSSSSLSSAKLDKNTISIAGTSVSLGGGITQNQLISNLGLKGLAFKDSIDLSGYLPLDGSAARLKEVIVSDLNDAPANSIFTMTSGYDSADGNKPTTWWVSGITFRMCQNSSYQAQLCTSDSEKLYYRVEHAGSWTDWKTVAFAEDIDASYVGLGNVENKSSATIRGEITSSNVTTALGYTPYNSANFTKANIKSTLGISDWALASSKPTYTAAEVGALSSSTVIPNSTTVANWGFITEPTLNNRLANYLSLAGGTITRSDRKQLLLKNTDSLGNSGFWIGGEFDTFTHGGLLQYTGKDRSLAIVNFAAHNNDNAGISGFRITGDNRVQVGNANFTEGYLYDIIHSGNISDYAVTSTTLNDFPRLNGTSPSGASATGTWGINISGSANYATSAGRAARVKGTATGNYISVDGGNWGSTEVLSNKYNTAYGDYLYLGVAGAASNNASLLLLQNGNVVTSGGIYLPNNSDLAWENSDGTVNYIAMYVSDTNNLIIGNDIAAAGYDTYLSGNNIRLRYGTSRAVGVYLNSSGNVTIGSSDLAGAYWKAYINGSTRIADVTITSGVLNANRNVNSGALLDSSKMGFEIEPFASYVALKGYNTSGNGVVNINLSSSGNVGIGITDPSNKLDVRGNIRMLGEAMSLAGDTSGTDTNADSPKLWLGAFKYTEGGWYTGSYIQALGGYSYGNHSLSFFTKGSNDYTTAPVERMRISPYGNVGIGTINPNTKLHVVGSAKVEGALSTYGITATTTAATDAAFTHYVGSTKLWWVSSYNNCANFNTALYVQSGSSPIKVATMNDLSSYLLKAGGKISGSLTFSATSGSHIIGNSTQGISFKTTSNSDTTLYFEQQSANSYSIRSDDEAAYWNLGDDLNRFNVLYCRSVSQSSDATLKNILGNIGLNTSQIANAPAVHFTWKNGGAKDVGTIAQYWKDVLPEVVSGGEGSYGMNYAVLGVVSSIILARNIETHEQRIARLEKEISDLQKELNALVNNE